MKRNLGETNRRRKRRQGVPMKAFDALPAPLRQWLSEAAMPWSPASVRRIWFRSLAKGNLLNETLTLLSELEGRNLERNKTIPILRTKDASETHHKIKSSLSHRSRKNAA